MLEFVRNNQKIMQVVLFIFILPSFIFLGVEGYSQFMEKSNDIAKIDNVKITEEQFDAQYKSFIEQAQANGKNVTQADTAENRKAILDQMIDGILMQKEIERLNISLDDQQVLQYINSMPALANIRNTDGSINVVQLKDLLEKQGMTPEQFQARIKFLLINQYLAENIAKSSFIPVKAQENIAKGLLEKREVQVLNISAMDLASSVQASPAQLQDYYQKNKTEFISPEKVDLEYILINKESIAKKIPSSDEIKKYYEANIAQFQIPEERKASHILVKVENPLEKEKLKLKAQTILDEVKKDPSKFAALAKEKSDDIGSAQKNGDLGFFTKGAMVKQFEEAAYKLKIGEISPLVESEFGFHIIQLTDIKPAATKSLEEATETITQILEQQNTDAVFAKQLDDLANAAMDSNNLIAIAKKLNFNIQTAAGITQENNQNATFADKRLLRGIFDPEVKQQKRNTDVIQFGNQAIIAHVVKYYPKLQQTFEQAKEQAAQKFTLIQGLKLAKQAGVTKLAAAKQGEVINWSPIQSITRMDNKIPKDLMESIFNADVKNLPSYVGIPTALGYALFKISKVDIVEADKNTLGLVQEFSDIYAKEEMRALMQDMRKKYEVKILKDITNNSSLNKN